MSSLRATNIRKLQERTFDVLVVGGGINGAVSAAALAGQGAKVALIDRGDFAGFTSMHSSNLAWGGIKYMETFEFGLVRKLCMSRNHLMRHFPSTVQEIRFFTTHAVGFRHGRLKLFLGTILYWLVGNLFTAFPRLLSRAGIGADEPIVKTDGSDGGFEYSDAYLHDNDARFVWNFVRSAINYGAVAANYVESLGTTWTGSGWEVVARDVDGNGAPFTIRAKALVNACGPFADEHNAQSKVATEHRHVFSKGIHLIVPRLTPHKRVLTFFADDGRLFFVIPMGPRSCIGTTDTKVDSPITEVTAEDRRFVLDNINKRLNLTKPLTEADIIAERCGVRPLVVSGAGGDGKDWMQLSRKHAVDVLADRKHVTVFGGKLTDCLNVGDEVAELVAGFGVELPFRGRRWYGEPGAEVREEFMHQAKLLGLDAMTSPASSEPLTQRLWRRYGAEAFSILDAIRCDPRMAEVLIESAEYIRGEIELARRYEMITKLDDFLRRRSKIALVVRIRDLAHAPGLREACRILFGDEADARWREQFGSALPITQAPPPARALPAQSA
jgi:glycerol-3-phosphate dehydrogenase